MLFKFCKEKQRLSVESYHSNLVKLDNIVYWFKYMI